MWARSFSIGLVMYNWWWRKWMVIDFLGIWLDDGNVDAANVVLLFLCLQWLCWMCFGVECGLCVGKNMKLFACGTLWTWGSWGGSPSLMAIKVPAETWYMAVDLCDWPKSRNVSDLCVRWLYSRPTFLFCFVFFPFFLPAPGSPLPFCAIWWPCPCVKPNK